MKNYIVSEDEHFLEDSFFYRNAIGSFEKFPNVQDNTCMHMLTKLYMGQT